MGSNDWILGLAAVGIGGIIILSVPSIRDAITGALSGLGTGFQTTDTGPGTGNEAFGDPSIDDTSTKSSSPCGQLCRDKNCKGYKAQCTTGCVHCPGSGPNSPGGGGLSKTGADCGAICRAKNCNEYKLNCTTGCTYCCGSGPNSPKCGSSGTTSTGQKCKPCPSGYYAPSGAIGCTCKKKSGSSGGQTLSQSCSSHAHWTGSSCACDSNYKKSGNSCVCAVSSCCPGCPSGKRKVYTNGKCGCQGTPSPIGSTTVPKSTSTPCAGLTGATLTACQKAHRARVLSYRAENIPMGGREWKRGYKYGNDNFFPSNAYVGFDYDTRRLGARTLGQFDFSNAYSAQRTWGKYDLYYNNQNYNRTFGDNMVFSNVG